MRGVTSQATVRARTPESRHVPTVNPGAMGMRARQSRKRCLLLTQTAGQRHSRDGMAGHTGHHSRTESGPCWASQDVNPREALVLAMLNKQYVPSRYQRLDSGRPHHGPDTLASGRPGQEDAGVAPLMGPGSSLFASRKRGYEIRGLEHGQNVYMTFWTPQPSRGDA